MFRKKGRTGDKNPEKLPVNTAGIEMTRRPKAEVPLREKLTGGNQPADERGIASLVVAYVKRTALK